MRLFAHARSIAESRRYFYHRAYYPPGMRESPSAQSASRRELGAFLRSRRQAVPLESLGIPDLGRRRVQGLRREEVAAHAGVSITWYTWLEQGKPINPSRQVLDAIAAVLGLTTPEHEYLLRLAGQLSTSAGSGARAAGTLPEHVWSLLKILEPSPALVLDGYWRILGWNRAYEGLLPAVARVPVERRNLIDLVYTDTTIRRLIPDWPEVRQAYLAEFRAHSAPHLDDEAHTSLVARLSAESFEFRDDWQRLQISHFVPRQRRFHLRDGDAVFGECRLHPADAPDLQVVVFLRSGTSVVQRRELCRHLE